MIDGSFAETRELVAGFWLWQVKNMAEAVEWVKRCPNPMPGPSEIEIRPLFEAGDLGEAPDLDTLHAVFDVVLAAEKAESIRQHGAPFAGIDPAPERFHRMWDHRSRTFEITHPSNADASPAHQMALVA